jgi:hypothetical protein
VGFYEAGSRNLPKKPKKTSHTEGENARNLRDISLQAEGKVCKINTQKKSGKSIFVR